MLKSAQYSSTTKHAFLSLRRGFIKNNAARNGNESAYIILGPAEGGDTAADGPVVLIVSAALAPLVSGKVTEEGEMLQLGTAVADFA